MVAGRPSAWCTMRPARCTISPAARRENVSSSSRCGSAPRWIRWATRAASVIVLPLPAPAITSSARASPSAPWRTASRCASLRLLERIGDGRRRKRRRTWRNCTSIQIAGAPAGAGAPASVADPEWRASGRATLESPDHNDLREDTMRIYNVIGWASSSPYALACMAAAPAGDRPAGPAWPSAPPTSWSCWFMGGVYLSCVIHMGIAHRALDYQPWFIKTLTVVNNLFVRLHRPGDLGQPPPPAPPLRRPRRRPQQAGRGRRLAHAVAVPVPVQDRGERGHRRDPQDAGRSAWSRTGRSPSAARCSTSGCCRCWCSDLRFALVMWVRVPRVRAVDQHGPELLDARPPLRATATTTTTATTR